MLARHEPDPGGELAPGLKGARFGDRRRDRRGADHADAGNGLQPPAHITRAMLGVDAAFKLPDLSLQRGKLVDQWLQGLPHRAGQLPGLAASLPNDGEQRL
jgi:hypothetical protein